MITQLPPEYGKVLRVLHARLSELDWVITGSVGMALQGVPLEVHDIDLQAGEATVYRIEQLLAEYVVQPLAYRPSARIRSHFGCLRVAGVPVELMGALQKLLPDGRWEEPVDVCQYRRFVVWEELRLPVLSLPYEAQAYRLLGRNEKADLLERFLAGRGED